MMKYVLALIATITLSGPAAAQHVHGAKGTNGGQMEDVAGVHAELMTAGNTITINVFDEGNKPIATKGFTASALVSRGPERETSADAVKPLVAIGLLPSSKTLMVIVLPAVMSSAWTPATSSI